MSNEPGEKIRVLIVDDIPETRENLRKLLQFEADIEVVGQASTGEEGIESVRQHRPHVVLMDINMPGLDGISASEAIAREVPSSQVVMMSVQSESDYVRRAMLAGARDFLTKPFSSDELLVTIRRVYERGKNAPVLVPATPEGGDPLRPSTKSQAHKGKVVTFFSPKGGVGCSVIAANFAVALAQSGKSTVLVDADLPFGDMGVLLDVQGTRSIVDLAQRFEEIDSDLVSSVLTAHSSGLKVLLAPPRPEMAELITTTHMQTIIGLLRSRFDYVVVDTFTALQDVMLTALDQADRIILVATPDIPCIKDTRLFFDVASQLDYGPEKVILILNFVEKNRGIASTDIENTLKCPVHTTIPVDYRTVMFSINQGVPFVMREPGKGVSTAVIELAKQMQEILERVDEEEVLEVEAAGRSRLSRLFGSR